MSADLELDIWTVSHYVQDDERVVLDYAWDHQVAYWRVAGRRPWGNLLYVVFVHAVFCLAVKTRTELGRERD